ncbi:MAG: 3D domain-containing protein [bacterium]
MDILRKSRVISFFIMVAVATIYMIITSFLIVQKVRINVDGKVIELRTNKENMGEIFKKAGISLGPLDIVKTNFRELAKSKGIDIKIIRVTEKVVQENEPISYTVVSRALMTRNLRPVELLNGYEGIKEKTVKITYFDQQENKKEVLAEKENRKNVLKLALKGKDNKVDKIYDLSKCKQMSLTATAYYPGDPMCKPYDGYTTYLGMKLRRGLVAVDPKVIRLGTRLYIPNYGYAYAADTGGMIKGKRIDLCVADAVAADKFGRQKIKVYILE